MEIKFNNGDRVRVTSRALEYGGKYNGCIGTIKSNMFEKYIVSLDDLLNPYSSNGVFRFSKESLEPVSSDKVLVGDITTGYSFVDSIDYKAKVEALSNAIKEKNTKAWEYFFDNIIYDKKHTRNSDKDGDYGLSKTEIYKVIFNNPATIVFWTDGTKTIVKCDDNEAFDEEKGLAMAISKKFLGNKGNYYNEFKIWLPKIEEGENV